MTFFQLIFAWIVAATLTGLPAPTATQQTSQMQINTQPCRSHQCLYSGQGR
jgi:hypothetical protein